ncbi:MAG: T9SS type A sorting domain-containing protein [Bacteroidota bacterium]|nr:T9SS type A sorting domain-containing protein [Bacteroidota bacterium]MDP3146232.1 T9SS type A sorting domain-containing protein [Bacteroidota bacterium]MDP3558141.1 T9SS type A sorting domain-containing protein [Bacteroidota bacterium]
MYKKIIILTLFYNFSSIGQNNIVPNNGFQLTQNTQTTCALGTLNSSGFNSKVQNWRVNPHGGSVPGTNWKVPSTEWINIASCNNSITPSCNTINNASERFIKLATEIVNGSCNKQRKDNVAIALENGATFDNTKTFKIRYKLVRRGANKPKGSVPQGCNYTLNFCHLRFFGSKKGPTNWQDNNNILEELSNANYQAGFSPSCAFQLVERSISFNSNQLTTLALLAESGGFYIDDVEVFESCDNNYIIQNKTYNYPVYAAFAIEGNNFKEEAGSTLAAGNSVGGNNGNGDVVIESQTHVIYTASNEINLKDGFIVQNGSEFHAVIAPCPNSISSRGMSPNIISKSNFELFGDENETDLDDLNSEIKIYPNPNSGDFEIVLNSEMDLPSSIVIQNVLGQIVLKYDVIESYKTKIDLKESKKGIYFAKINYSNYTVTKKIIYN